MPDRTFTIVREGTCQSLVVVLFTSAGVVNGLLSVLGINKPPLPLILPLSTS